MTIPNSFYSSFSSIHQTTEAQMRMNLCMTNWQFKNNGQVGCNLLQIKSLDYNGCNLGIASGCVQSSHGVKAVCYPFEALLQSK